MRTGLKAIQDSIANAGSGGGTGRFLTYFSVGDGEVKYIRFITDVEEMITTKFYEFVVDSENKFQTFVQATDLHASDSDWDGEDWVLKYGGKCRDYVTKELIDPVPRERTVAIAVEREEYTTEVNGRKVTRTRDKIIEVEDKEGKKYPARNFFLVKQAGKNFWNTLVSYHGDFGTLCDRDYKITRIGSDKNTVYTIIPKSGSEDPDWDHGGSSLKELQEQYGYGTGKDMDGKDIAQDSPERFLYVRQTLKEWVEDAASEERAKSFLKGKAPGGATKAQNGSKPGWDGNDNDEPQPAATVASEAMSSQMASLRARLDKHT